MIDAINSAFVGILSWIYGWMHSYGWSVVMFTLFIRIIVLPLDIKSRKGMRDMQRIQPKLAELQKKYANDKEKLNQKTMELYKKENVSMSAGCLPMLLQYPILIFMFTAMRVVANEHTVSMILTIRDTGVIPTMQSWLWIKNVFQPDAFMSTILPNFGDKLAVISPVNYSSILTAENIAAAREFLASDVYKAFLQTNGFAGAFKQLQLNFGFAAPIITIPTSLSAFMQYANGLYILPIMAGVSQFFMTKIMNMTSGQTKEQKELMEQNPAANSMNSGFMKWFFPLFSVWICVTSNAAFSIYWMTVNIISIIQTICINKYFDHKDAQAAASAGSVK